MHAENHNRPGQALSFDLRLFAGRSALALLFIGITFLVLYGSMDGGGKEQGALPSRCAISEALVPRVSPHAMGELASLSPVRRLEKIAKIMFQGPNGSNLGLEDFSGRLVLVNLWATWCVPCRAEMPALEKLQSLMGGPDFEVVTINIDTARLERREAFLKEAGIRKLAFYSDKSAAVFQVLRSSGKATGLPTTLIVGPDGCEIANMAGAAEWDAEGAIELISDLLKEWREIKTRAQPSPS